VVRALTENPALPFSDFLPTWNTLRTVPSDNLDHATQSEERVEHVLGSWTLSKPFPDQQLKSGVERVLTPVRSIEESRGEHLPI